ncbi:MAG: hypothetical protein CVV64_08885 [Candidatus Wallbacteria bacterium HGW-Wallbacteria-1]|jgi:tetratricopeptide (TPR) repeat protein|uniref:Outer membrane lipoprotein BamD-like domain-containing protein n=1 Tax=Candidatus Wallbacteria bacterium HGW-Wallbacteria-1 TaxID=2013854 RepID=A0A2N1PQ56_9BACT|nr:MAG: hypothetical protein CVV64_08885 [Candidatus Wallbacteria bacterium HGW-Wallbacteria-1]
METVISESRKTTNFNPLRLALTRDMLFLIIMVLSPWIFSPSVVSLTPESEVRIRKTLEAEFRALKNPDQPKLNITSLPIKDWRWACVGLEQAWALMNQEKYSQAITIINTSVKLWPNSSVIPQFFALKALCLRKTGQTSEALELLLSCSTRYPHHLNQYLASQIAQVWKQETQQETAK